MKIAQAAFERTDITQAQVLVIHDNKNYTWRLFLFADHFHSLTSHLIAAHS